MRTLLKVVLAVVVILVLIAVALPVFVNADRIRPELEKQATQALGRQVTIGKLKLAIFQGGVTAEDLAIADDPRFSKEPFLTAKSMSIGVDLWAFILHRQLNVRSFTIHVPKVQLIEAEDPATKRNVWNYSSLAQTSYTTGTAKEPSSTGQTELAVSKFLLDNGELTMKRVGASKTSVYSKLRLEATDVSMTRSFPFSFSAVPAGGGTLEAKGKIGPIAKESDQTPLTVDIKVRDLNVASTGMLQGSAIKGLVDLDANMNSNGKVADVTAHVTGKKLCLAAGCKPIDTPVAIDLKANYGLADQIATIKSGVLKVVNSSAALAGTIDMKGEEPKVAALVNAPSMAVPDIVQILPALGVVLPGGTKLEGGTASLKATANGALSKIVANARVSVLNTTVTGYDLGAQLAMVTKLMGVGNSKETQIQELSSDVQYSPSGINANNILLIVPTIGRITGDGTINAANEMNFVMKASVDVSKSAVGVVTAAFGRKNTNINMPFHITGTTSNPKFVPDTGKMLGSAASPETDSGKGLIQNLGSGLGGLFSKKK
jgi:AsmA protein